MDESELYIECPRCESTLIEIQEMKDINDTAWREKYECLICQKKFVKRFNDD